jgi:hypothetical protein
MCHPVRVDIENYFIAYCVGTKIGQAHMYNADQAGTSLGLSLP